MRLQKLLNALPSARLFSLTPAAGKASGTIDADIKGIAYDSREVKKDFLFIAAPGENTDGCNFIPDAVRNGAAAIVTEKTHGNTGDVPQLIVPDARDAMTKLACRFFEEPSAKLILIGVTGTNGKTTTTYLIESVIKEAGFVPGVIGTINYRYMDKIMDAPHTTPEAPDLQKTLKEMADSKVTHCVMEVSSHALSQKRVDGCVFKGGVFTNLTQDHLDYHKTMNDYFKSKARLFEELLPQSKDSFAVINGDDKYGMRLKDNLSVRSLTFSLQPPTGTLGGKPHDRCFPTQAFGGRPWRQASASIYPEESNFSDDGITALLSTPTGRVRISSKLLGEYNLQNIMAAVGVGIELGFNTNDIEKGISNLAIVEGRIERMPSGKGFQAVVDYAHTGDALERLLTTIRNVAKGRVITVFGCGGNRDRGKRPVMGEIAARLSDIAIITSDNPRNEDPLDIIKEIERGIKGIPKISIEEISHHASRNTYNGFYMVIPDRRKAIEEAVNTAEKWDFIVIAGKGHEKYQIIGDKKIPFDDVEEVRKAIRNS